MSVLTRRGYPKDGSQPRCAKGVVPGREAQAERSIGTGYRFRGSCILCSTVDLDRLKRLHIVWKPTLKN